MKKYNYLIIFLLLIFSLFLFLFLFCKKNINEPCVWCQENIDKFLTFQTTVNPQRHFDMQIIQQQASEDDAIYLLDHGYWPWSEEIKYLYLQAIANESILGITPAYSLDLAQKIYNENAMKKMLSWNTKEGQFLLEGGKNKNGEIKCFTDANNNNISKIKKIQVNGYNLWNGYKNESITNVKNEDLPKEMPGFTFIKSPCNPCLALDDDYSCPFKLNIKGNDTVSDIWKIMWNLS